MFDVVLGRGVLQVGTLWTTGTKPAKNDKLLILCICVCVCVAAPMGKSNPAATPVWTTAPMDNVQLQLAPCCLSASKI